MEKIKIEEKSVKFQQVTYSGGWGSNRQATISMDEDKFVQLETLDEIVSKFKRNESEVKELKQNQKVYFHSNVVFPRKKFKNAFTTNKIVYSPESADVIIVDKRKLLSNVSYIPYTTIVQTDINTYRNDNTWGVSNVPRAIGSPIRVLLESSRYYKGVLNKIHEINDMIGKPILDIKYLSLPSEETLNEEAFERLNVMLSSEDDSMKTLAVNMLTAYDYEKDKGRIALLMTLNYNKWKRADKKANVEMKSLLSKLSLDYPEYQNPSIHNNRFWIKMKVQNPDDPVIDKAFNTWLKKHWEKCPDVELKIKS